MTEWVGATSSESMTMLLSSALPIRTRSSVRWKGTGSGPPPGRFWMISVGVVLKRNPTTASVRPSKSPNVKTDRGASRNCLDKMSGWCV